MEIAQGGPRLDAELVDQRAPRRAVGLQGLRLSAAAVQRDHQLRAQTLAQRVLGDERPPARQRGRRGGRAPDRRRCAARSPRRGAPPAGRSRAARTPRTRRRRAPARATAPAPRAAEPRHRQAVRPRAPRRPRPPAARTAQRRARRRAPRAGSRGRACWSRLPSRSCSARRSWPTWFWSTFAAVGGAASPHNASTRRSLETVSLRCNSSRTRTARCLPSPIGRG